MPVMRDLIRCLYRGANRHKEMTSKRANKHFHPSRGIQPTGIKIGVRFKNVKEMIPEIVVPNLDGFKLKPYVSHKCPDTEQPAVTARELFDACVEPQVRADFKTGKYSDASSATDNHQDTKS